MLAPVFNVLIFDITARAIFIKGMPRPFWHSPTVREFLKLASGLPTECLFVIDTRIDVVVVYGGYIAEIPKEVERYVSSVTP